MEARMKMFGHPIHQMITVVPLGLLVSSWLFDLAYLATGDPIMGKVVYWNIGLGIVTGVIAAIFDLIDWRAIPAGTRAKRVGIWHTTASVSMLLLFMVSWVFRDFNAEKLPSILAFCFSTVAVGLCVFSGWLGGELVYRYTVGIKDGAGLNAVGPFMRHQPGEDSPDDRIF